MSPPVAQSPKFNDSGRSEGEVCIRITRTLSKIRVRWSEDAHSNKRNMGDRDEPDISKHVGLAALEGGRSPVAVPMHPSSTGLVSCAQ